MYKMPYHNEADASQSSFSVEPDTGQKQFLLFLFPVF